MIRLAHILLWSLAAVPPAAEPVDPPNLPEDRATDPDAPAEVSTVVEGQVVDALGRGVADADITVAAVDGPAVHGSAQSGEFGDFTVRLAGRHYGRFTLTVGRSGFVTRTTEFEVDPDDPESFIDVALVGSLSLSGTVVQQKDDVPIAGAQVALHTLYRNASAITDAQGRFSFEELIASEIRVTAEADGFGREEVNIVVQAETPEVRIALDPERVLVVTVLDNRDAPVHQADVELAVDSTRDYRREQTDERGQVTFRRLPYDQLQLSLRVSHARYVATGRYDQHVTFDPEPVEKRHVVHLVPAAEVRGTVRSRAEDRVLNGVRIDIDAADEYTSPHAFTNLSGRYRIGSLEPGVLVITARVAGHAPDVQQVTVAAEAPTVVDFELDRGRTITGVVVNPDGRPVWGAEVRTRKWRGFETLRLAAFSDAAGKFVLPHAPTDAFRVDVVAPGQGCRDQAISAERDDYRLTVEPLSVAEAGTALCRAAVGDACPALNVTTLGGRRIDAATIAGKVILFDFWATWCGPCVAEVPTLKNIYQEHGRRGDFMMIGVSNDFDQATLERFIKQRELPWDQVFGPDSGAPELSQAFGVQALPCTILLGRDGKIVAVGLVGEALQQAVGAQLGSKPPADGP